MTQKSQSGVLSHWHILIEDFQTSALDFYDTVEAAVKEGEAPDLTFSRVEWHEKGILSAKRTYLRIERGRVSFDICAAPYGRGYFFSWWLARKRSFQGLGLLTLLIVGLLFLSFLILQGLGNQGGLGAACGAIFLLSLLWLGGLPFGLFLLGGLVEQGAIGDEEAVLATPVIGYLYALVFNPYSYYQLDTAAMFRDTVAHVVREVIDDLLEGQGLRALSEAQATPAEHFLGRG